jgi:hypothetical protein
MRVRPAWLLLICGCAYDPQFSSGVTACGPQRECPEGYKCFEALNRCFRPDDFPTDALPEAAVEAVTDVARADVPAPDAAPDAPPADAGRDALPADSLVADARPSPDAPPDAPPDRTPDAPPDASPDSCPAPPTECNNQLGNACASESTLVRCERIGGCLVSTPLGTCPQSSCRGAVGAAACRCSTPEPPECGGAVGEGCRSPLSHWVCKNVDGCLVKTEDGQCSVGHCEGTFPMGFCVP